MWKNQKILRELNKEILNLEKQKEYILYSYNICKKISFDENINDVKLMEIDALAMRFSRASDIIARKILRLIYNYENQRDWSLIDWLNFWEKLELIWEEFDKIREQRNFITHDYSDTKIEDYFDEFIKLSPVLIEYIDNIIKYNKKIQNK